MEWLTDPTIWVGLLTLVVLEIILGIDNLIFVAILADKVPPSQRDRARVIGLRVALLMRLGLLASISWVMSLTARRRCSLYLHWRFLGAPAAWASKFRSVSANFRKTPQTVSQEMSGVFKPVFAPGKSRYG